MFQEMRQIASRGAPQERARSPLGLQISTRDRKNVTFGATVGDYANALARS